MADSGKTFRCEISGPDGPVTDEAVHSCVLPAADGYMGIMAGRAPLAAVVGTGQITLTDADGEKRELFVSRGFLRVRENHMTILAEECKPLEDLDAEEAWDLLQQAYALPQETDEQRALRDEALQIGRTRFSLAQKIRKRARESGDGLTMPRL